MEIQKINSIPGEDIGVFSKGDSLKSYTKSRITYLIDEHIHHKRDREIMKMHYVDGISAEIIAKEIGKGDPQKELTHRRVSQILSDRLLEIAPYL